MFKTLKNIYNLAKHFDVVEEKDKIVLAPKLPLNLGTKDNPIGEVFMDKDTLYMIKEKGANFEQLVVKYDSVAGRYVIQSEQGGTGSNRNLSLSADGGATPSVYVRTNGNVGINNTNPSSELDVSGQVTINPESPATPPLVIGANGDGQLVTGLNAEFLNGKQASDFGGNEEVTFDKIVTPLTTSISNGATVDVYSFDSGSLPVSDRVANGDLVEFLMGFEWSPDLNGTASELRVWLYDGSSETAMFTTDGVSGRSFHGNSFVLRAILSATETGTPTHFVTLLSDDSTPEALTRGFGDTIVDATQIRIRVSVENTDGGARNFDRSFVYVRKL